jgi:hypothetical protein
MVGVIVKGASQCREKARNVERGRAGHTRLRAQGGKKTEREGRGERWHSVGLNAAAHLLQIIQACQHNFELLGWSAQLLLGRGGKSALGGGGGTLRGEKIDTGGGVSLFPPNVVAAALH